MYRSSWHSLLESQLRQARVPSLLASWGSLGDAAFWSLRPGPGLALWERQQDQPCDGVAPSRRTTRTHCWRYRGARPWTKQRSESSGSCEATNIGAGPTSISLSPHTWAPYPLGRLGRETEAQDLLTRTVQPVLTRECFIKMFAGTPYIRILSKMILMLD